MPEATVPAATVNSQVLASELEEILVIGALIKIFFLPCLLPALLGGF